MPIFKNTKYTNNEGKEIPAEIAVKKQTPTDTVVQVTPRTANGTTHLITLSGPDSSVKRFDGENGYVKDEDFKDYWVRAGREAYNNRISQTEAAKKWAKSKLDAGKNILSGISQLIGIKQQGGIMGEQNIQKQVVELVQAAMQGNQEATQQIEQIMQAAKQGDQQAMQIAQMIQQVIQAMKTPKAEYGTKLDYIKKLKGDCPDGEVKVFLKNGGCLCRKKQEGGEIKEAPKKKMNAVEAFKAACGKKLKK